MDVNDGDRTSSHGSTEMERSMSSPHGKLSSLPPPKFASTSYGGAVLSSSTSGLGGHQANAAAKAQSRRERSMEIEKEYANIIGKFDRNIQKLDSMRERRASWNQDRVQ